MFKRILKLSICALLLISMTLGVIACSPKPSEDTFKEAQKDSVSNIFSQVDNISNNIAGADPNNVSRDVSVKFELSTELLSMLASMANGTDMSWINNLSLNLSQNSKDGIHSIALSLLSNGKDIISANGIADVDSGNIYVAIPLLASAYLQLNLDELMGGVDMPSASTSVSGMLSGMATNLPDTSKIQNIVNRYYGMIVDAFDDVEFDKKAELSIGDIDQRCIEYTATMSRKDVLNTALKLLEKVKTDNDIKDIVLDMAEYYASQGMINITPEEAYNELIVEIDDAIEEIKLEQETLEKPNTTAIIWTSYMTKKAEVLATSFKFVGDDNESYTIFWGKAQDKKNSASEMWVSEGKTKVFMIEGEFEEDKNLLSGTYKFEVNGKKMLSIKLDEIDTEQLDNGFINGSITIYPESGIEEMIPTEAMGSLSISSLALKFTFKHTSDSFKIKVSVLNNKSPYISVTIENKTGKGKDISLPTDVVSDPEAWASNFNLENIMNKITEIGIPEELLQMILSSIGGSSQTSPETNENEYYFNYNRGYDSGYENGYYDGYYCRGYDSDTYTNEDDYYNGYYDGYTDGYNDGYDVGYNDYYYPDEEYTESNDDYGMGLEDGYNQGYSDAYYGYAYDDSCNGSDDYENGYCEGYRNGYFDSYYEN